MLFLYIKHPNQFIATITTNKINIGEMTSPALAWNLLVSWTSWQQIEESLRNNYKLWCPRAIWSIIVLSCLWLWPCLIQSVSFPRGFIPSAVTCVHGSCAKTKRSRIPYSLPFCIVCIPLHCFWLIPDLQLNFRQLSIRFEKVPAVKPRLLKIISTYGKKCFSHIEVRKG